MSDLIFVSDSHLRSDDEETDRFLRFLAREGPTAGTVILVGDIFDLWVARRGLELAVHRAVVDAVARLRGQSVLVKYVQGNRDYFVADRYRDGPFSEVAEESLLEVHGGRRIHVSHGDLVNPRDRQYLFWRRFSRSAPVRRAFEWIPSRPAGRLSSYLERRFRTTNLSFRRGFPRPEAEAYAREVFARGADTVVLGHFHEARLLELEGGALFVLPGWREEHRYLRVDGSGEARFAEFPG